MALGMILENGWPECDLVDCDYATVHGTPLRLPFQRGFPHIILQALLRDLDQYIEPVMNARGITDEGSWTEDNSVYTSNHKGATAFDYNWDDHPMGQAGAGWNGSVLIAGDQVPAVNDLLAWYEGMVFWGNNWSIPKDSMHFQMGYDTYGPANAARVQNFIDRKIRADGYSVWRRGGTARGGGETPPVALPAASGLTAAVLAEVWDNRVSMVRYEVLAPMLVKAFHCAGVDTIDRRAMALAQLGHESGGGKYQGEIASGAAYEGRCSDLGNCFPGDGVRFKGRDFLQITGRANYLALSKWAFSVGVPGVTSPTFFVDSPGLLAEDEFAFVGFAWYWITRRNGNGQSLNDVSDARNIDEATRMINGGYNGLDDRKAFYARALAANTDLLDPTDSEEPVELHTSRSIYRTSNTRTMRGDDASLGADACAHMNWVESCAIRGEQWALELVRNTANRGVGATKWWEVDAGNENPGIDEWAVNKALNVLNYIAATNPAILGGTK